MFKGTYIALAALMLATQGMHAYQGYIINASPWPFTVALKNVLLSGGKEEFFNEKLEPFSRSNLYDSNSGLLVEIYTYGSYWNTFSGNKDIILYQDGKFRGMTERNH